MYIHFPKKKIIAFLSMMFFIVGAFFVTNFIEKRVNIQTVLAYAQTNFRSVAYRVDLHGIDPKNLFAAAGLILGHAQNGERVVSGTSTAYSLPVLLYHGIVKVPDRFSITEEGFKDQMFALKKAGYQTVSVEDVLAFEKEGRELPAKSFLLTFDDGRMDSYVGADPILKALNYRATMYVATAASLRDSGGKKNSYYIASSTIQDMVSSGRWEIGSHAIQDTGGFIPVDAHGTKKNFLSNKKWLDAELRLEDDNEYRTRIQQEFIASQRALEDTFNIKVHTFSYPFGDYGQQQVNNLNATATVNTLIKDTYQLAFKQVWPNDGEFTFNYHDTDPYFLKRIETPTDWSGAQLITFLETGRDKSLPFTDDFGSDHGWKRTWGVSTFENNHLVLQSTASTTGAAVFLDGTKLWNNYIYTATMNWQKGSHVSLMTKYQDSKNYYVCTFSDAMVRLEKITDGKSVVLNEAKNFIHPAKENISLGVVVQDNFMRCRVGRYTITFATINPGAGGIGVKIWDKELNNAEVQLQRIMVEGIPTL